MTEPRDAVSHAHFQYKKRMGQHFLFDDALLDHLVEAAEVGPEDGVLEIGPGSGSLTQRMARIARRVLAVELDRELLPVLQQTLADAPNAQVVQGDILKADLHGLVAALGTPCRVVANLPYNITKPVLQMLFAAKLPVKTMALMVQREVAMRMMSQPGDALYSPTTLMVQYYACPEAAVQVPRQCFTPPPRVDSTFVLLRMRDTPAVAVQDEEMLFRVIQLAFAMRRKTLLNNLQAGFSLSREETERLLRKTDLSPQIRGERLSLAEFARLSDAASTRVP